MNAKRTRRAIKSITTGGLMASLATSAGLPATATDLDKNSPLRSGEVMSSSTDQQILIDPITAQSEDSARLAQANNESIDATNERHFGANECAQMVTEVQAQYPDSYADSSFNGDTSQCPWISFKGGIPSEAMRITIWHVRFRVSEK